MELHYSSFRRLCLIFLFASAAFTVQAQTQIFYVKKTGGSDANAGTSWASAFQNLNKALAAANLVSEGTGVEIRVAAGVYKPDEAYTGSQIDRKRSFELYRGDGLNKSLKIYGGYPEDASTGAVANPSVNPTYLDGDLGVADVKTDNCYHVAIIFQQDYLAEMVIDGLIIRNGYADGYSYDEGTVFTFYGGNFIRNNKGGGLVIERAPGDNILIKNCVITENTSVDPGDGGSAGAYFADTRAKIENCTFSKNNAVDTYFGSGAVGVGGGAQFSNCNFENNKGRNGGAVTIDNSNPTFTSCNFSGNESTTTGGAINMSSAYESTMITGCTFINNKSTGGGALFCSVSSPQISGCLFEDNEGTFDAGAILFYTQYPNGPPNISKSVFRNNTTSRHGGAMRMDYLNNGTVSDCIFDGNSATGSNSIGGALYLLGSGLSIENIIFLNNSAAVQGGAIYDINPAGTGIPRARLINSTFTGNSAPSGGAYYHENSQGYIESNPEGKRLIINNIFWNNNGGEMVNSDPAVSAPVTYSIVKGGYSGTGNMDTDPFFKNESDPDGADNILGTADDGIGLLACSPAIDKGMAADAPQLDILGSTRFNGDGQSGSEPDMGAYESQILQNPPSSVISGTTEICPGNSAPLAVAITNGTSPFVLVYTDGTNDVTVNNYQSGNLISVSPAVTTTYTVVSITDANKCEAVSKTGSAVVTVLTPPSFSVSPVSIGANTDLNLCSAVVTYTATVIGSNTALHPLVTSYELTGATTAIGSGTGSGQAFNKGVTIVKITSSNGCAPDAIHTFNITVTDNQNPTVAAALASTTTTSSDGAGNCSASVSVPNVTFGDNCPGSGLSWAITGATTGIGTGQVGSFTFNKGISTITYTVTDAASLTATSSMTVTVTDNEVPTVAAAANVTTTTSSDGAGNCSTSVSVPDATFGDNCPGSVLSWAVTGATTGTGTGQVGSLTFNKGISTITYTVTDAVSLTATSSLSVTVTDDEAPTVAAAANITSTTSSDGAGNCSVSVSVPNITFGDNCPGSVLSWAISGGATGTGQIGSRLFNVGEHLVEYTVTDEAGTDSKTSFTLRVTDDEKPVVIPPANIETTTSVDGSGNCQVDVIIPEPQASDNCNVDMVLWSLSGATAGYSGGFGAGVPQTLPFNVGVTTITYRAIDVHNNDSETVTMTVTVIDDEKPAKPTLAAATGECSVTLTAPTTTDNCAGTITGTTTSPLIYTALGTYSVTWTFDDGNGNVETAIQSVVVDDVTKPVVTAPANVTVTGSCGTTSVAIGSATATDNCTANPLISNNAPVTFPLGITEVIWTATDEAGNEHTAIQSVTVNAEIPTLTTPLPSGQAYCNGTGVGALSLSGTPGAGVTFSITGGSAIGLADQTGVLAIPSFTAINSGTVPATATITVTPKTACATGVSQSFTITVNPSPVLAISGSSMVCAGSSTTLTATPAGGSWSTNLSSVATVTNGLVTAVGPGTASIAYSFTDGNTCQATVYHEITVSPSTLAANGESVELTVTPGINDFFADNCHIIARIVPSVTNGVSGIVKAKAYIDATLPPGQKYVARHYDISPVSNPDGAVATVTLYFTQQEFTDYNTLVGSDLLPTGPTGNKSNLYVSQFHGTSSTGAIGSYSGGAVLPFHPANDNIQWNSTLSRWEVTFEVQGFSGFFITGNATPLPVTLTRITAKPVENNHISIEWETSSEVNFDYFELERSINPKTGFSRIGRIQSFADAGKGKYSYNDGKTEMGVSYYYRLKMVDKDGSFAFSRIVSAFLEKLPVDISLYPNPAIDAITIRASEIITSVKMISVSGMLVLDKITIASSRSEFFRVDQYHPGMYTLLIRLKDGREYAEKVVIIR